MHFTRQFFASKRLALWLSRINDQDFLRAAFFAAVIFLRLFATGRFGVLRALVSGLTTADPRPGGPRDSALTLISKEMSQSAWAQYLIGLIWLLGHQPLKAEVAAQRALDLRPSFQSALLLLGGSWLNLGYFKHAEEALAKVVAKSPRRARAWAWRGTALVALGRYDEATDAYRRALAWKPKATDLMFLLADHLLYMRKEDEARALLLNAVRVKRMILCDFWNGAPDTRPSQELLAQMMLYQGYVRVGHSLLISGRGSEMVPYYVRAVAAQDAALNLVRGTNWLTSHGLESSNIRVLPPIWVQLVSHIALLDKYLKLMELGWSPKKRVILLAPPEGVVNQAYLDYWRDRIEIITDPNQIFIMLPVLNVLGDWPHTGHRTPDGNVEWMFDAHGKASAEWGRQKRPPLLSLKPEHRLAGRRILEAAGIPSDAWFVCLHVREPGFFREGELPYAKFRNANIGNFELAVQAIRAKGGYVVRVGDSTMMPYPPTAGVFDYALSSSKSDWMDVFLCADCRFFVGSTSGLYHVPGTFGVPCVLVNWVSFCTIPWECDHIYIPKLIRRNDKSGELLSFREMLDGKNRWIFSDGRSIREHGFDVIDNSPEEVREAVEEMMECLDGRFDRIPGDAERIEKFAILSAGLKDTGAARISTKFLRRHATLLS